MSRKVLKKSLLAARPERNNISLVSVDKDITDIGGPFDLKNPRALINLMPDEIKPTLQLVPHKYFYSTEEELYPITRPTPSLNRLRLSFWKEYESCQAHLRRMLFINIAHEIGMPMQAAKTLMDRPENLAWILCPPASYDAYLEESLQHGMKRLREILELPLFDANGNPDQGTAGLILKTVAFIDMRVKGGIVQKNLNLNVGDAKTARDLRPIVDALSLDELENKIKELENRQVVNVKEVKDPT